MFSQNNNTVYFNRRDKLVNDYNNTRHSSIKITSVTARKKKMRNNFRLIYMEISFI